MSIGVITQLIGSRLTPRKKRRESMNGTYGVVGLLVVVVLVIILLRVVGMI